MSRGLDCAKNIKLSEREILLGKGKSAPPYLGEVECSASVMGCCGGEWT